MTTSTCCTGDCLQGRECPLRQRRKGWWKRLIAAVFCLSLTGCATIQTVASSKETFAVCQAVDVATTYIGITKVGLVEANPIMAAVLKHGWLPVIGLKAALVWWVYNANFSPAGQTVANVVACAPGVWNTHLLVGQ
jgi:uncharacterized protein YceK